MSKLFPAAADGQVPSRGALVSARLRKLPPCSYLTVALPVALAILYYGLITSDVYVSESRFIVKNPYKAQSSSVLAQMMAGAGSGNTESYAVVDYLKSRDALAQLNTHNALANAYSRQGDWLSRYHTGWHNTFESLWRYYKRRVVDVQMDDESSIITLEIDAFNARDAHDFNEKALELGESLVNEMNRRAADDAEAFSQGEVDRAEQRSKKAMEALAAYRAKSATFDPDRQSTLSLQQVAALQNRLFAAETQLSQLQQVSPANPQIPLIRSSIKTLQEQIAETRGGVTSASGSLAATSTEYTNLQLEAEFAAKYLGAAMGNLEQARAQAQKKQIYLERLVQPNLPDEAIKPKRIRGILTVLIGGLVLWAVLSLLVESVNEHRD